MRQFSCDPFMLASNNRFERSRVRADESPRRLNVASDRPHDGTRKCRLGRLAMDGVM
jgi:hypothetical protein